MIKPEISTVSHWNGEKWYTVSLDRTKNEDHIFGQLCYLLHCRFNLVDEFNDIIIIEISEEDYNRVFIEKEANLNWQEISTVNMSNVLESTSHRYPQRFPVMMKCLSKN